MDGMVDKNSSVDELGIHHEHESRSIYWILRWLLATITIVGNVFLVVLIASRAHLRSPKNWFVASLAVADFSIGAFNCPTEFISSLYGVDFNFDNAQTYFLDVSSTCLVAMAMDRYLAVMHPFKYQSLMTKSRQRGFIALTWLIPLFVRLPLVIGLGDRSALTYYDIFTVILLRGAPLVVLPITFSRVVLVARKINRRIVALRMQVAFNHGNEVQGNHARNDPRGTQSSVNATAVLVAFFTLSNALDVWDIISVLYSGRPVLHDAASDLGVLLVNLNSAVNFVVYGLLQKDFRREMLAFCCICCGSP